MEFKVSGGKLMVSDPCYDRGTWCQKVVEDVLDGTWKADVIVMDENGGRHQRVCRLEVWHERNANVDPGGYVEPLFVVKNEYFEGVIGVDSGQAGIFSDDSYPPAGVDAGDYGDLKTFYGRACAARGDGDVLEPIGLVDGIGVISSAGYGDGSYDMEIGRTADGKCIFVQIEFIQEDEIEEDFDAVDEAVVLAEA